jgi:hypothetical protein
MEKTAKETKESIVYGSFLQDLIVDVKAIESSGRWRNLLVDGQGAKMKKEPYLFGKIKRSFQVPLNDERKGGGIKIILDNNKKIYIEKYMDRFPKGMTEQEFFEKELNINLNPTLPKDENFWRTDKRGRVTLTKAGTTLNLNLPMDMIRYKILMCNKKLIAPNYDERKNRATYEFMIVNQGKLTSRRIEEANIKAEAFKRYTEITASMSQMRGFIKSLGRTLPANHSEDWMKAEILTVLENSNNKFLSIVNDPMYNKKIFVQEAVEAGAIKRMNNKRYVLDNGVELGDLVGTINWLSDPEHQETRLRITSQIEMAKSK